MLLTPLYASYFSHGLLCISVKLRGQYLLPQSRHKSTGMGHRLWVDIYWHTTSVYNQPTMSTQCCILLGYETDYQLCSGKGENVTTAGWQVTLIPHGA